jgi:hypothetical protein
VPAAPSPLAVDDGLIHSLELQEATPFSAWPVPRVPRVAAGVYTIWRGEQFIYVGMAGRGMDERGIQTHAENGARKGLADRLNSHASGRRSGDQFCVYIADRLVLPALTPDEISLIGRGQLSLDAKVRDFIRANLQFRFVVTRDGRDAAELERTIRHGALPAGKPFLNPL